MKIQKICQNNIFGFTANRNNRNEFRKNNSLERSPEYDKVELSVQPLTDFDSETIEPVCVDASDYCYDEPFIHNSFDDYEKEEEERRRKEDEDLTTDLTILAAMDMSMHPELYGMDFNDTSLSSLDDFNNHNVDLYNNDFYNSDFDGGIF